jgi:iron complex outermembrane receptor protein
MKFAPTVPAAACLLLHAALPAHAQEQPATAGALREITVSTPRGEVAPFNVPGSVDRIDGSEMRDSRLQVNLSESLGAVPGLQVQNRLNYAQDLQLSIRGFGARSTFGVRGVRLYVDGIPATLPDGQGQTSNIDIGSMDRVEVLRGPFSALYGNSSGGVVQAFTASGEGAPRLSYALAGGSFGTWRQSLQLSGSQGAVDYLLDASRFHTDGWREQSAARRDIANGKLGIALDNGDKLTLIMNSVRIDAQDPLGLTADQYALAPRLAPLAMQYDTRKTVEQTQAGLLYERRIDARQGLRLMLYSGERKTTQYQSIPPSAQQSPLHAGGVIDLSRQYGGIDLRWSAALTLAGRPFDVVAGLGYDTLREKRRGYENYVGPVASPVLGVRGRLRRNELNEVWNLDPYAQATWRFARPLDARGRRAPQQRALRLAGPLHRRREPRRQRQRTLQPDAAGRLAALPGHARPGAVRLRRPRLRDADAQRALVPRERRQRPQLCAAAFGERQRRARRQGPARGRLADGCPVPDPHGATRS